MLFHSLIGRGAHVRTHVRMLVVGWSGGDLSDCNKYPTGNPHAPIGALAVYICGHFFIRSLLFQVRLHLNQTELLFWLKQLRAKCCTLHNQNFFSTKTLTLRYSPLETTILLTSPPNGENSGLKWLSEDKNICCSGCLQTRLWLLLETTLGCSQSLF